MESKDTLLLSEDIGEFQLENQPNWFKTWVISISIIYCLNFLLDYRQLNMYYDKHRPALIKKFVKKEEFRKCQTYSKAKAQFSLLRKWLEFMFKVVVWSNGWPVMIWASTSEWTKKILTSEESPEVDPVTYDFVQGLILIFGLQFLDYLIEIPLNLFSIFVIAENHGFNK